MATRRLLARTGYSLQRSDMSGVGGEPDSLPSLPGVPLMTQRRPQGRDGQCSETISWTAGGWSFPALDPRLLRRPLRVSRVKEVEDFTCLDERFVVAASLALDPLQYRLETPGVRHRNAADIEEMDRITEGRHRRIVIETEAREKRFEGDPTLHVREHGAVEVEANGTLRAIARPLDPDEPRVSVDEALDEPRAGEAIHPGVLPRRPHAIAVPGGIEPAQLALRRMRLTYGERPLHLDLEGGQRVCRLSMRRPGIEIDRDESLERSAQALHERLRLALAQTPQRSPRGADPRNELSVFLAAVEQLVDVFGLRGRPQTQLGRHRESARRAHCRFRFGQGRGLRRRLRQHVNAIAQNGASGALEQPPHPHANGGVAGGEVGQQGHKSGHFSRPNNQLAYRWRRPAVRPYRC